MKLFKVEGCTKPSIIILILQKASGRFADLLYRIRRKALVRHSCAGTALSWTTPPFRQSTETPSHVVGWARPPGNSLCRNRLLKNTSNKHDVFISDPPPLT